MTQLDKFARDILQKIVDSIEIPSSHYKDATDRYRSLGEWLHRKESTIANDGPEVYPQGSFRLGTVIPPLNSDGGYDLDLVCELRNVEKDEDSQANLKARIGAEIVACAKAHDMKAPEEGRRCWKLAYAASRRSTSTRCRRSRKTRPQRTPSPRRSGIRTKSIPASRRPPSRSPTRPATTTRRSPTTGT